MIKTGCPASPDFKRQYCAQHKSHACDLLNIDEVNDELGTTPGPALRSRRKRQHATWEPASSVPQDLVAEFEAGVTTEANVDTTTLYDHVSNTMTMTKRTATQPEAKKRRTSMS